eukprot:CAMPEP_0198336162 /NCGR_PEP_ID=MMETSP1450-20131203/20823_1 /TAXON_ID=753684 ORGANISM="Madagascaria erythrocladiodes, Strain CCMP3234" /NCGR_SAMPLE_ID=MMETSP1450 /ASSEMBLY_ACC=CAM_ASM_001115 /LENGTH=64 /DNA_ID=CAMNT_0044040881 /DNA_START=55 /DNA_END=246 /DNA_ORIENTATION=-
MAAAPEFDAELHYVRVQLVALLPLLADVGGMLAHDIEDLIQAMVLFIDRHNLTKQGAHDSNLMR